PAFEASVAHDLATVPGLAERVAEREASELYRRKLNAIARRLELALAENQANEPPRARGGYRDAQALAADLALIDASLRANRGARLADGDLARFAEQVAAIGFHFVHLDVRQHQARHRSAVGALLCPVEGPLESLDLDKQQRFLEEAFFAEDPTPPPREELSDDAAEVLATLTGVREAQARFGPDAVRELVISNTTTHADVLELLVLARRAGLVRRCPDGSFASDVDLVPLFESVTSL